jgi:hypothetical protein
METDINFRVQTVELVFGRVHLFPAQVLCGVKNLPLQIRHFHLITINDPQGPNTGRCEVKGGMAAQSPSSNHQDLPLEQADLPLSTQIWDQDLAAISFDLFWCEPNSHGLRNPKKKPLPG